MNLTVLLTIPLGDCDRQTLVKDFGGNIMKKTYKPTPLDTEDVILPPDLIGLQELLAENAHDHWAQLRMAEGWTYGDTRDNLNKKTPLLVPYHDLPDSEKLFDRATAMETLKAIIKLGFSISRT